MELQDQLVIHSKFGDRYIQLFYGDLCHLSPTEAVDVLIISTFPNHYSPAPGSLIGSLARRGVVVL